MDLRAYYREVVKQEEAIPGPFALIVSCKTSVGGQEGVISEVARGVAAKMIVEKTARLATAEEEATWHEERQEAERRKQLAAHQERVRLAMLAEEELAMLKRTLFGSEKGE